MLIGEAPISINVSQLGYLALLALLPLVVVFSRRSLAGLGSFRRTSALVLRCAVIAALAFALADPQTVRKTDDQVVIFATDGSNSVPEDQQRQALSFIARCRRRYAAREGRRRRAALRRPGHRRATARRGTVDRPRKHRRQPATRPTSPSALRLAMALFPEDTAKRLVVLSDGNENHGTSLCEAGLLRRARHPDRRGPAQVRARRRDSGRPALSTGHRQA